MILCTISPMIILALIPTGAVGDIMTDPHFSKLFGTSSIKSSSTSSNYTKSSSTSSDFKSSSLSSAMNPFHIRDTAPSSNVRSTGLAGGRTDGWVEMTAKIDMRAIVEILEEIPETKRILGELADRVGRFDQEKVLATIMPEIAGLSGGLRSGFNNMNKIMHDLMKGLYEGPLSSSEQKLLTILEHLESNAHRPAQCDLSGVERGFGSLSQSTDDLLNRIQENTITEMKTLEQGILGIRENGEFLLKVLSLLDSLDKKSSKGFGSGDCEVCQGLEDIFRLEEANSKMLNQLGLLLQRIPREIGVMLQSDSGFGGIRKDVQKLVRAEEGMSATTEQLAEHLSGLNMKIERFFTEHQRIIIDTKYAVAQTGKIVQKTAASTEQAVKRMAFEASRAMKLASRSCT